LKTCKQKLNHSGVYALAYEDQESFKKAATFGSLQKKEETPRIIDCLKGKDGHDRGAKGHRHQDLQDLDLMWISGHFFRLQKKVACQAI